MYQLPISYSIFSLLGMGQEEENYYTLLEKQCCKEEEALELLCQLALRFDASIISVIK